MQKETGCTAENVLAKNTAASPRGMHYGRTGTCSAVHRGVIVLYAPVPPRQTRFLHSVNHVTVGQAVLCCDNVQLSPPYLPTQKKHRF